ncbi:MAG: CHAT domain-containing protein, partial [Chitinophagaceae bacterium]
KNYSACAAKLNNIGYTIYFKRLKNYRKALNYYYQALQYATSQDSSNTLGNIANVFVEKGIFESAFYYFQKAFDQIRPGITEAELLNTFGDQLNGNYTEYISGLLLDKADAHLQQYKISKLASALQKALHLFRLADSFFTRIKYAQSEQESKLSWRAKNRRLYEHAIEAAYFSGLPEEAFYFFEKSRAVLLHDQLNEQRLFNQDELLSMAQIKRNQSLLQQEADTILQTSARYKEIQQNLFNYSQRMDGLIAMIKRKNPLLYESFIDSSVLTMSDIRRKILVGYTALVELFSGDSSIYSLVITNKEIWLNRIDKDSFQRLSASFFSYDSSFDLQNSNFSNYIKISNSLYHLIFDGTSIAKGRVIISPDGTNFPFEALVINSSTVHPVYFLEDYSVSYTYSAGYLLNSFKGTSFATGDLLGLAPVQYHYMPQLNSLEGSDQSLDRIASYFGKHSQLIGNKATRRSFMDHYAGYSIIQLYTHASDKSVKDEPVIWFSDSALYLSDLVSESKPITRLIVLSACETGSGKFYEGEGVFSFNRGFAALGIPAAITNLWSVDSKSTYELTELFYKYLADGFPTDIALQKAKLQFIQNGDKEKGLPFYWAAPILVGNTEVIQLSHSFRWTWLWTVVIGLSAIGLWYFLRRRRKLRPLN